MQAPETASGHVDSTSPTPQKTPNNVAGRPNRKGKTVYVKKADVSEERARRDDLYTLLVKLLGPYLPNITSRPTPAILVPLEDRLDDYFECIRNGSSVRTEIFAGIVNFFSCLYCLPVLSSYMINAGYSPQNTFAIMALLCGLGSITSGFVTNTPMIIAPPTAECIFLVSFMQNNELSPSYGNLAVVANGAFMLFTGLIGPFGRLIVKFIPRCIQIGTTVGIGLLTALAGSVEINFVERGVYKVLRNGPVTSEIEVALSGLLIVICAMIVRSRFAYVLPLLWGTFVWWTYQSIWPSTWLAAPQFQTGTLPVGNSASSILAFSLMFLTLLTAFGMAKALSDMAGILKDDGSVPCQQWLILIIGAVNIASGLFFGPAFTILPETQAGIRAGAKTGLSAVVCGLLFIGALFFGPFFMAIPPAATSPLLVVVGMVMFLNIQRLDFTDYKYTFPAFCTLFYIPFTSSTLCGLVVGYFCYTVISIFTLDIIDNTKDIIEFYLPDCFKPSEKKLPAASTSSPMDITVIYTVEQPIASPQKDVESSSVPDSQTDTPVSLSAATIVPARRTSTAAIARRASAMLIDSVTKRDNFHTSLDTPVI